MSRPVGDRLQTPATETEWSRQVQDALKTAGWLVTRVNAGRYRGLRLAAPGTADLICCSPEGRYVEVEVKAGSELRPAQQDRHLVVAARDARYEVVRTMDDLETLIREGRQ